jgi:radical SAM superfamily enzyme YgiQ (UPF0313 family)
MKILLVYPEQQETFWSFKHALKFVSKKAEGPPLGLLTVAAMLPKQWEVQFIDLNVNRLEEKQLRWAEYVFLSGMNIQRESFMEVVSRCNQLGVKVVAGGPLATSHYQELSGVDYFVLNEAEATLPKFIEDLENGWPQHVYATDEYPEISLAPLPRWDLVNFKDYASMYLQYSRGCPFNCEFCSITQLNGRRCRVKSKETFMSEVDAIFEQGWRGGIFIVDDNFIGNKKGLKVEILPALIEWQERHGHPYVFNTEVSINLADDDDLISQMVRAGFNSVFVGIETPNDSSLAECGKLQNLQRDMVASVRKLHRHGIRVSGGFIIGFDNDPENIFEQQMNFIQKTGIVSAMVGLLNAPTGTRLFHRLKSEKRLLNVATGDNMDGSMNFIPKMDYQKLMQGYKNVLQTIYSQKTYYERVKTFLSEYNPPLMGRTKFTASKIKAFFKLTWQLGFMEKGNRYYWKLLLLSLFKYPKKLPLAVTMAGYGFHFRQIVSKV